MISTVVRRLIHIPVTVLLVTLIAFVAIRLSGDVVDLYLPQDAPEETRQALREKLRLDDPLPLQYGRFLLDAAQGDFGVSLRYRKQARLVVGEFIGPTAKLAGAGFVLAIVVGLTLGWLSAIKAGSWLDNAVVAVGTLGQSVPTFWLGIMLIMVFAVRLRWFPTSGTGGGRYLVLPSVTLAFFLLPQVLLMARSSAIETMQEQYITVAHAKGLRPSHILLRHVAPNALNPVVSLLGLEAGRLVGGAVITESVFGWPGLGWLSLQAVVNRDMPIVQATVILLAVAIALSNLVADVVNAVLDPRIRQRQ